MILNWQNAALRPVILRCLEQLALDPRERQQPMIFEAGDKVTVCLYFYQVAITVLASGSKNEIQPLLDAAADNMAGPRYRAAREFEQSHDARLGRLVRRAQQHYNRLDRANVDHLVERCFPSGSFEYHHPARSGYEAAREAFAKTYRPRLDRRLGRVGRLHDRLLEPTGCAGSWHDVLARVGLSEGGAVWA